MQALVDATVELIVEKGLAISVREIALRADVNHGLVHTYFGSKNGLLDAAFDHINERAAAQRDDRGFPPPDLAERHGGELARAIARVILEAPADPFTSHPILPSWKAALTEDRPDLTDAEMNERLAIASALGLGWALFADYLSGILELDDVERQRLDARVAATVADIGGIPTG